MSRIAIFALTRGYEKLNNYNILIKRNRAIWTHLPKNKIHEYDFLLFHEGNITDEQQDYICELSGFDIDFMDIRHLYVAWNEVNPYEKPVGRAGNHLTKATIRDIDTGIPWSTGYRNMCHFYAIDCINILLAKNYSHALRIDEDCIVTKGLNFLGDEKLMFKNNLIGTPAMFKESYQLTNKVLPRFLKFTGLDFKHNWEQSYFTNSPMVYSNVNFYFLENISKGIVSTAFINKLKESLIIHRCRAGDAPLLFWLANTKEEVLIILKNLEYNHISHRMIVEDGVVRQ